MEQELSGQQQQTAADATKQDAKNNVAQESETKMNETDQAVEQWLRRIPDDPSGLMRRKFRYQYRRQQQPSPEAKPW